MQVVQDCDPFYGGDVVYVILDMIQNRGGVDVCVWVYCVCDSKVSPVGAMKPVLTTITSYWGKGGRG